MSKENQFYKNYLLIIVLIAIVQMNAFGQTSGLLFGGPEGGLEGSATMDNTSYTVAQAGKFVNQGNTNITKAYETTTVRTGASSVKITSTSTSKKGFIGPLTNLGGNSGTATGWVVQFWRRTSSSTLKSGGDVYRGVWLSPSTTVVTTVDTWEKFTKVNTSSSTDVTACAVGFGFQPSATTDVLYIDDICMYWGTAVDNTAPDSPTAAILSPSGTSMGISWTAPSTGVDGGGYMVIRGTSDLSSTDPNVNGIYAVGNSVGSASVVYCGTSTSFTDAGLTEGTTYYYKIYTVDKAYNYSTGLASDPAVALPVEMTSFTATSSANNAILNWKTATEVNNYGFEIERRSVASVNSKSVEWTKIGFITGNGTSNSAHNYSYADASVSSGTYAYRLKQIDHDGTYKYSSEAEVSIQVPNTFALNQNFPNPFNPTTTIAYTIPEQGMVSLIVYDVLGRQVGTLINEYKSAGSYTVSLDASKLSSGVYFYCLQSGSFIQKKKMVLLK
jgi:hypothetical protein